MIKKLIDMGLFETAWVSIVIMCILGSSVVFLCGYSVGRHTDDQPEVRDKQYGMVVEDGWPRNDSGTVWIMADGKVVTTYRREVTPKAVIGDVTIDTLLRDSIAALTHRWIDPDTCVCGYAKIIGHYFTENGSSGDELYCDSCHAWWNRPFVVEDKNRDIATRVSVATDTVHPQEPWRLDSVEHINWHVSSNITHPLGAPCNHDSFTVNGYKRILPYVYLALFERDGQMRGIAQQYQRVSDYDLNRDGEVNIFDLTQLVEYMFGEE